MKDNTELYKKLFIEKYQYLCDNRMYLSLDIVSKDDQMLVQALSYLEDILLSDRPYDKTIGYVDFESLKQSRSYLRYIDGVRKFKLKIQETFNNYYKEPISMENNTIGALCKLYEFIELESCDEETKRRKLEIVDEYIRMARYSNDGKVWNSGYGLTISDVCNNIPNYSAIISKNVKQAIEYKGLGLNDFIMFFSDELGYKTSYRFSEKEKGIVYLKNHDAIPYGVEIRCQKTNDSLAKTPYSYPCNNKFILLEDNIYYDFKSNEFFTICPKCEYMITVNKSLLSDGVQKRIISRTSKYDYYLMKDRSEINGLKKLKKEEHDKIKTLKRH